MFVKKKKKSAGQKKVMGKKKIKKKKIDIYIFDFYFIFYFAIDFEKKFFFLWPKIFFLKKCHILDCTSFFYILTVFVFFDIFVFVVSVHNYSIF